MKNIKLVGVNNKNDREVNDFYATSPIAVEKLFELEEFSKDIWECACGQGHLSKKMIELGKNVTSTDLIDRNYGVSNINFLLQKDIFKGDIITNPPYSLCNKFITKGMTLINNGNKLALLLRTLSLEGIERKKIFTLYPPKKILVFSKRLNCAKNGEFELYKSSAMSYSWFVWEKGFTGDTIVKWI